MRHHIRVAGKLVSPDRAINAKGDLYVLSDTQVHAASDLSGQGEVIEQRSLFLNEKRTGERLRVPPEHPTEPGGQGAEIETALECQARRSSIVAGDGVQIEGRR